MTYRHILLAIDLAPNCDIILQRASEIAQQSNAQLDVIHVVEHAPLAYSGEFSLPIDIDLEQTLESVAQKSLQNLCQKFSIPTSQQHIIVGTVKHEVIALAEKLNSDLILVGSHGHHGIDQLLGSRANAILHAAKCDVLAIRIKE